MSSFADSYLMAKAKYFPAEALPAIKSRLEELPKEKEFLLTTLDFQDPTILLVVSLFGGSLGIDRFLLGEIGLGIAKLLTGGACGIWTIVDWFLIMGATKEANLTKLMQVL